MSGLYTLMVVTLLSVIALCVTGLALLKKTKEVEKLKNKVVLSEAREKLIENEFQALMELINQKTRELEDQRNMTFHASKMSALGQMAGGIAHEINNPLTIIMATIRRVKLLMQRDELDQESLLKFCENLETKSARISRIIEGLRLISREASGEDFKPAILINIIEDVLALCEEKFRMNSVDLQMDYENTDFHTSINCQRSQLSQVFWNLLENSFDAIINLPDKWIRIEAKRINEHIEIRFIDSGKKLSEELQEKVFQPFFTTKEVGKGTGLGLSLSLAILKNHQGDLYIDQESSNTCFVVKLPVKTV